MRLDAWRMFGALVAYRAFMHQKACDQWPWPAGQPDFYRFIINIDVAFNAEFSSNADIFSAKEGLNNPSNL
ncbi:hypothetical protein EYR04_16760 [Xanthomonas oryzae pv. oryzae]|nr:hypothetical protein EYR04_16760 [Xanthomonas oryzae pv. oryzae]